MTRCQTCGTECIDGAQYCDECGSKLSEARDFSTDVPNLRPQTAETPLYRGANVTSVGIPPIVEDHVSGNGVSGEHAGLQPRTLQAKLVIERGDSVGTEFNVRGDESNIGRWDADNGIFPDIDLDSFDPEAKVSRRHARIVTKNGKFAIEDLGSTNGTYINRGRRLIPGNAQTLEDGDEIIVGKTFLRFHIND